jgi:Brp/Blh family beta-carotene 15,15'-monooxygenase
VSQSDKVMSASLRRVLAGFVVLMGLIASGVPLTGTAASTFFCLALLLLGLPHGALDIERLKSAREAGWTESLGLFAVYLALAALTYAAWTVSPVIAMGLFLVCAVLHFAEDWRAMDDPLLALGTAAALLAAPALFHKDELRAIFAVVTGEADGALLAEIMRAIAPVALGLAIAGMLGLVRSGREAQAACCALLLTAMAIAPPLAAFALFFCLYHSPLHLREAWQSVTTSRGGRLAVGAGLTAASVGIAALLAGTEWRGSLPDSLVAATFMTFSVLTVPHMLSPLIVGRWRKRRRVAA